MEGPEHLGLHVSHLLDETSLETDELLFSTSLEFNEILLRGGTVIVWHNC